MNRPDADEVFVGKGATIGDNVVFEGRSGTRPRKIAIGHFSHIGANSRVAVDELVVGDYTTIHHSALIAGDLPCRIGHCCWIGQNAILNSTGGLYIGRGVGVGAYSQLWTHIRHGDVLQGCRWNSTKQMTIEDDVWFVGHCIVSPIHAKRGSMALAGSVVTRDMEENHVYAGVPAKDVTDKVGPQFAEIGADEKRAQMGERLRTFLAQNVDVSDTALRLTSELGDSVESLPGTTSFNVISRTFNQTLSDAETRFMRFLLPDIKFFPDRSI